jgi:nitroreductase
MITNETLKIIKQRRSIRSFNNEQIKEEEIQAVLEAGLYAPNAGDQAWHFTVIQNKELLTRLNLIAKETAKQMNIGPLSDLGKNENFDCLYGAPTLVIVSGSERAPMPLDADCAAATQNLLLAAESIGLGSCWIFFVLLAFRSPQGSELRKELKIPEGYRPYNSAILGYKKNAVANAPDRKPNLITYIR